MTGQEETASRCARGGLNCMLRKSSSLRGLLNTGTGCPGKWGNHHPRNVQRMFRCGTCGHGSDGLMIEPDDLKSFAFQPDASSKP